LAIATESAMGSASNSLGPHARDFNVREATSLGRLLKHAQGQQLSEITSLIESGVVIRPVVDKVFPFEETRDALAYVETGRAKVVITVSN
jgi:NADPH:quinone reductase-like Zn-dependent oxidoreductase